MILLLLVLPLLITAYDRSDIPNNTVNITKIPLEHFRSSSDITVSGISSGAYFATQFMIANSKTVLGAASFSGGPYWCANCNVITASTACMKSPNLISVTELVAATHYAANLLSIDPPRHLKDSKMLIYHPKDDTVVVPGVSKKLEEYVSHFIPSSNVKTIYDKPGEHAYPTIDYGNSCKFLGDPYINNCKVDGAKEVFDFLIGPSPQARGQYLESNLFYFDQFDYKPHGVPLSALSMANAGAVYVPTVCQHTNTCPLHVVFHGCHQSVSAVGETFIRHSGYCQWAESRNVIVLFPQIIESPLVPYNPNGCYDFWGYTGANYATKYGGQMSTVANMVEALSRVRL
ncbi:hypothetical protein RCL1_001265 [Eukaryota sp. TZLM3-RCL]